MVIYFYSLLVSSSADNLYKQFGPRFRGYKTFFMLNTAEHKLRMVVNVKTPTIVGILTFISMINTAIKSLKVRKVFIFQRASFYEQSKFRAQLSWA